MAGDQANFDEGLAAGAAISEDLATAPADQQAGEQAAEPERAGAGYSPEPEVEAEGSVPAEPGGAGPSKEAELYDRLLRLQAEFDNYRKRVDRQQRDMIDNAATGLVKKLLPVLDTADLALAHGGGEDLKQLAGALFDLLSKEGLERLVPEGQPFDPEHHDAVAHEPAEGDDAPDRPEVSEVMRAGYMWKGRVLRPAMVKVRG